MTDTVENFKGGTIQHGKCNDRIHLIKLGSDPSMTYPRDLICLAKDNNYSKIFTKVPEHLGPIFAEAGYVEEAFIPFFFSGKEAVVFMSFFLKAERAEINVLDMENMMDIVRQRNETKILPLLEKRFSLGKCNKTDIPGLVEIYKKIFASYPFPINDSAYLADTMDLHVDYFAIETDGKIISASAAEKDMDNKNAELTDFATLPEWRGNGFAQLLLAQMECDLKKQKIKTAYTIARAMSPGMNITFKKSGYKFCGRLRNNTNISGRIESMNVWYKSINDGDR
jgi:putative beta-lysine N-acetyltransferase